MAKAAPDLVKNRSDNSATVSGREIAAGELDDDANRVAHWAIA